MHLTRAVLPKGILSRLEGKTSIAGNLQSLAALVDQLIVSGTTFFVTVLVGQILGPNPLGIFSLGLSIVVFMVGLQTALVSTPWTIQRAQQPSGRATRLGAFQSLCRSLLMVVAATVILGLSGLVSSWASSDISICSVLFLLSLALPFILLKEFVRRFDFARMNMLGALTWDCVAAAIQLALLAYGAWSGTLSLEFLFVAWGVACSISCAGWFACGNWRLFEFARTAQTSVAQPPNELLETPSQKWLLIEHVLWTTAFFSLHWIVFGTMSAAETGILAACTSLAGVLSPVWQGAGNYLAPQLAACVTKGTEQQTWSLLRHSTSWLAATAFLFCLVLSFCGDWLLATLFSKPEFQGFGFLAALLGCRMGFLMLRVPVLHTLLAMRSAHLAACGSGVGLLAVIILGPVLGSQLGLLGVGVIGMVASATDLALCSYFVYRSSQAWNWTLERGFE